MQFDHLSNQICKWLKPNGNLADVVISSRIRFARNINNFPFVNRADNHERERLEEYISSAIKKLVEFKKYAYLRFDTIGSTDIHFLFERHLISKEHAKNTWPRSLFFQEDESLSLMVNEEDHIRLQGLESGLNLSKLYHEINRLDDSLEGVLPYAFHPEFGYATACPTNAGTGFRASVMVHLPAICLTNQISKVYESLQSGKMNVRGLFGEGTVPIGDFFQISNRISMGLSEQQIIENIEHVIHRIVQAEQEVRQKIMQNNQVTTANIVQKSYRDLLTLNKISCEQAMSLLSVIRLGVQMELLPLDVYKLHCLILFCQPYHLQQALKIVIPDPEERDIARAKFIRDFLQNKESI